MAVSEIVDGKDTIKFVDEKHVEEAQPVEKEQTEEQEGQSAAFNPETGEINWDCPCLGGMAQGPCGEEFKAAFSCFVYSEAEPKGLDCVEKFKGMQDCFRLHPDVYGDEIDDEEEEEEEEEQAKEEVKEETQEETVVASSPYEEEESNNTFSSWISSWF